MANRTGDLMICSDCLSGRFADWIADHGAPGECEVDPDHDGERTVAPASDVALEVDAHFRATYCQGEYEYGSDENDRATCDQRGSPFEDILYEELGCDTPALEAITAHLPDTSDRERMQGGEYFYDSSLMYEAIADIERRRHDAEEEFWYDNRFQFRWNDFCDQVQYRSRFFNLERQLTEIFGSPDEYESGTTRPIHNLDGGTPIFRARVLDRGLADLIAESPVRELGAPPEHKASAGRMNVEFIPAFYGAFHEKTAVAETRPGIGDEAAIAEFVLTEPLKVFDFTVFNRAHAAAGDDVQGHSRYDFITAMEEMISKPVMFSDRQREYIPTQIVAEFLKLSFGCDAVIYRSAMMNEPGVDSRNVVILNRGRGQAFTGDGGPLTYVRHHTIRIRNVSYDFSEDPF